ncbi:MAG: helix-turn-helix domain-containing protein [Candidatus Omnitrophica bacterium]|nr:helix-turn-helix domain-containing protein [Candidatus Omnitrophota bacterium]
MVKMSDYISVKEASIILRCTRQEVVRKIWRGFIKAEKIGKVYIILKSEIKKLKG